MCRTIVGVSANLCPVDPEGKNLHSSVSSQFAEGIRQSIKDLAPNFRATAFDPRDHTIEAIEAVDGHRIMGLQWHPEYLVNEEKGNLELFRYLLQEL